MRSVATTNHLKTGNTHSSSPRMKNDEHTNPRTGVSNAHQGCPKCAKKSHTPDSSCSNRLLRQRAARFLARLRRAALPMAIILASAWGAAAKSPSITARLEPSEIAFGDIAQLTVTLQGQDQSPPAIPAVNGLSF